MVQFLPVAIALSPALNPPTAAPQLLLMFMFAAVVPVRSTKLLNTSTKASRESWQLDIFTVRANTISIRESENELFAKFVKSEPELVVIDAVDNAGIDVNDLQKLKILDMFVTLEVSNNGTNCKETQSLNIANIVVTLEVSNNGTDCKDKQLINIVAIFVTIAVFNNGTDCKDIQVSNILNIDVTLEVSNNGTDCKDEQPWKTLAIDVQEPIVLISNLSTILCATVLPPKTILPPLFAFGIDNTQSKKPVA